LGGGSGGGVMVGTEPEQKENNTLPVNNKWTQIHYDSPTAERDIGLAGYTVPW
jgi:hypothetical protein